MEVMIATQFFVEFSFGFGDSIAASFALLTPTFAGVQADVDQEAANNAGNEQVLIKDVDEIQYRHFIPGRDIVT